ncbi:MAG: hypothetical protein EXR94_07760 [Gemmatimonadetes bacterium]|nr:hypothetical protein [Gemmatimonadota bacterium]
MTRTIGWSEVFLLAAACGAPETPVPGRVGSIVFTLVAGRDTAVGDVMMVPANIEPAGTTPRSDDPMLRTPASSRSASSAVRARR